MKVDVLQVFISTSAIFGIGILWLNFNQKVFATVCRLVSAPFEEERKNAAFVLNSYQISIIKTKTSSFSRLTTISCYKKNTG